uniref:Uncharacterized protein n=1 Tax=Arundo donax TaxID=35708 RepID=A0A0A9CCB3_ARUDO
MAKAKNVATFQALDLKLTV